MSAYLRECRRTSSAQLSTPRRLKSAGSGLDSFPGNETYVVVVLCYAAAERGEEKKKLLSSRKVELRRLPLFSPQERGRDLPFRISRNFY
jgi:hypothetical protein